jgi:tetratricopeptide (TPR) repeat protein
VQARDHALVPAACGAYLAYLAHAAVDWDWEMPAVTVAALFCGLAILVAGRRDGRPRSMSQQVRVGAVVVTFALSGFALLALVGNSAVAAAEATVWDDPDEAEAEARKAIRWAFWSSDPWRVLGQAQLAKGDASAARASLRKAIAKEPRDWNLWYQLALASDERKAAREALAEAARLNPRSVEVAQLRSALAAGRGKARVRS